MHCCEVADVLYGLHWRPGRRLSRDLGIINTRRGRSWTRGKHVVADVCEPVAPLEAARDAAAFPRWAARVDLLRVAVGAAVHFTAACTRGERAMLGCQTKWSRGVGGVEI